MVGFEGLYEVSDLGRVRSLDHTVFGRNWQCPTGYYYTKKGQILKPGLKSNGYLQVGLHKDGKIKTASIHRLVAEAFFGGSDLTVNHKNEDKTDNRLSNLEYMTARDNVRYSAARPVESYDLKTLETIKRYPAEIDVRADGYDFGAVNNCCLKKPKYLSHHGVGWRFADVQAT